MKNFMISWNKAWMYGSILCFVLISPTWGFIGLIYCTISDYVTKGDDSE